jgi:rhamnosyltransferase
LSQNQHLDTEVLFSIIIPVKNGDHWLENLFQKLMQQTLIGQSEIIVIDSGSTDKSLEIIKQYPVKLIQIPSAEFNHGETRNLGAREARGKYVVMTVQDAVPVSNLWLQYFLDGFIDENVAGVSGQQVVPHELDKNPVLWFRPVSTPKISFSFFKTPEDFFRLTPCEQRYKGGWDNVTSAYRRETLLKFPFAKIDFAEDILWSKEMLLRGYTLGVNDNARVFHYHHQLPAFVLPRYFSVYYFEYKIFKLRPEDKALLKPVLSSIKILLKETSISWPNKFKWFIFNTKYLLALKKTIKIFNTTLDKGEDFLDIEYQKICKKIPQAPKY